MKKINIFSAIWIFAIMLSSCNAFLQETPIDQMPEEEAFKNPDLIYLNTVASLYTQVGGNSGGNGIGGTDRGLYDIQTFTNDEAILPTRGGDWEDGGVWRRLYSQTWATSEAPFKSVWDYLYRVIGLCNQSLDKLNELIESDPENVYLPIYKAEVQAFRAIYYYYLVDLFARVPIVETSDVQISEVRQSSRSEVYDFAVSELQAALPYLSNARSNAEGEYYGRITQPVAYAVLCKLAINAQVYNDDDWTDNGGVPNGAAYTFTVGGQELSAWDATIAFADSIKDLGYELAPNFSDNFSVGNETSKENIFTIPMDPVKYSNVTYNIIRSLHYAHAEAIGITGWNGASATKELIATLRDSKNDPRLELSFHTGAALDKNGNPVMDGDNELVYKPESIMLDTSGTPDEKTAGARFNKYAVDPASQNGGNLQSVDHVVLRYADILLMKAEAKIRKGESGDAEVNEVRGRVGADALSNVTLDELLDERARELSWEGHRRSDLVRFGKFNVATDARPTAADAKVVVFPIPQDVIELNANLTQNYNY